MLLGLLLETLSAPERNNLSVVSLFSACFLNCEEREPVKVGLVLNMANNQWLIAKSLRRAGIEADLIISSRDFGMSFPHWEEAEISGVDPYTTKIQDLSKYYTLPAWVKIWDPSDLHISPQNVIDLLFMVKQYELLQLSVPSVIYLQFIGKKFIVHEAGWLRRFPYLDGAAEKLARRGYSKAECVVMTNADCYHHLSKIRYRRQVFIPFVIDTDRYRPIEQRRKDDALTFFHPTRHVWNVKGNQRLLYAFAKFIEKGYKARLVMMDWGTLEDTQLSKELVERLGIESHVHWLGPVSKPTLIQLYNSSDAVFDQFLLGCYGTTAPEAMACGRPVVMRLDRNCNEECYGEFPPILNVETVDEVLEAMIALTDPNLRSKYGEAGRRYVIEHHSPDKVANQYIALYREVLG